VEEVVVRESGSKDEKSISEAHRKIVDTYARLNSYKKVADEIRSNERHVRRVVHEHAAYLQDLLAEIRQEDRAWERRQREVARLAQEGQDAWVDSDAAELRKSIDELIKDTDPRVRLAAIKLKIALRSRITSTVTDDQDARVRRTLEALEGFGSGGVE
jgi:C4-dicarboxylate-specific signal transduction histidine kinase